jgi:CHAT domain-containing protein
VANAPGELPLRLAADEAAALADRYGARRLPGASMAETLAALPEAHVVEFLCHASSDPGDPLESGLYARDGRLTVRTLLGRPPSGRQLIILGACETSVIGSQVPDEIIGLPLAFIQAGATGVVATQWRVREQAAWALLRRFREEIATGMAPARALSAAQDWLGHATWGELAERYPSLFRDALPPDPAIAANRKASTPFDEPRSWAAFCYTGS